MTKEFNFESWLEEAQNGLSALKAKREALVAEQENIKVALEDTDKEIGALASMLDAYIGSMPTPTLAPDEKTRVTGIKKTAKAIAERLVCGVNWGEDQLVSWVLECVPGASESSTRKAIQTLAREGVFLQSGERGAWSYSTTIGKTAEEALQEAQEPPKPEPATEPVEVEAAQQPATEPSQQWPLIRDNVMVGTSEVITALTKEMKNRTSFAMEKKNIDLIAADMHCDPKIVRDTLKIMVEGDWELAYEGEKKVLRRKAEPDSREDLKRTHIKDQPLFPDADRPPHA